MSQSDGSTADYYQLPPGCTELQDLISYRNLNAQDGEIFRAIYRKGRASHSDELRDARKVLFYAQAEVKRLEALRITNDGFGQQHTIEPTVQVFNVHGSHTIEPAAAIDDESPRMQAIGQNGNGGEHYDAEKLERWKGAPNDATHWRPTCQNYKSGWLKVRVDDGKWLVMLDDCKDDEWSLLLDDDYLQAMEARP